MGSNPNELVCGMIHGDAGVAQLGERGRAKAEAAGSNPATRSIPRTGLERPQRRPHKPY
jgi:hypothetical protein